MSRMLDALKSLESRTPVAVPLSPAGQAAVPAEVRSPELHARAPQLQQRPRRRAIATSSAGKPSPSLVHLQDTIRPSPSPLIAPAFASNVFTTDELPQDSAGVLSYLLSSPQLPSPSLPAEPLVVHSEPPPPPATAPLPVAQPVPLEIGLKGIAAKKPLGEISPLPSTREPTFYEQRIRESLARPSHAKLYANLVERLQQDFRGSDGRTLLFTGVGQPSRGDELLSHIAALFAQQGTEVLLVDADFQRASLTAGFGSTTLCGLQNCLGTSANWHDQLIPTSFPQLSFLPVGRGNLNVMEAALALDGVIEEMSHRFGLVLIDGGESAGGLQTAFARACDATYFVIRLGATDARSAEAALRKFRAAGARVMGCVATLDN